MIQLLRLMLIGLFLFSFQLDLFAQFPPENDDCFNALVVTDNDAIQFTTANANTDGPNHPDNCLSIGSTPDVIYADIWYRYTPDYTGQAIFSTCSTADFDTKIAVYAGTACPPAVEDLVGCNEDGSGCSNSTSSAIFDVVAGETYTLRIGGYGDGAPGESGAGTFLIGEYTPPPGPPNDDCENAIEVILDDDEQMVIEFSTINSNTSGPFYDVYADENDNISCFDLNNNEFATYNDVWFKWTSTFDGAIEFSNCGTANFDSRITAYGPDQGTCPPDPLAIVGCSDDGLNQNGINCTNFTSRSIFNVIEGGQYLFNVGAFSTSGTGMGTVLFKRTEPLLPPPNDNCADAEEVEVITREAALNFDVIYPGQNFNSTFEGVNPVCRPTGEFYDVWYKFNSGTNTQLGFTFNIDTEGADFIIDLFSDCGVLVDSLGPQFCYRTDNFDTQFQSDTIQNLPGVPTDYLLRVSTRITTDAPGEFWFQLIGDPLDTGIQALELRNFKFYPNPATTTTQLSFDLAEATNGQVAILNTLGQVVKVKDVGRLAAGEQSLSVPIADLSAGIYFFRLQLDEGEKTIRFVKK